MSFVPNPGPPPFVRPPGEPSHAQEAQRRALEGTAIFAATATVVGSGRGAQPTRRRGELFISPDAMVFTTRDRGDPERFGHTERGIALIKGRLCPPWANTFLLLQDKATTVRIALSLSARRSLRRALRDAGVSVDEQSASHAPRLAPRGGRRF